MNEDSTYQKYLTVSTSMTNHLQALKSYESIQNLVMGLRKENSSANKNSPLEGDIEQAGMAVHLNQGCIQFLELVC